VIAAVVVVVAVNCFLPPHHAIVVSISQQQSQAKPNCFTIILSCSLLDHHLRLSHHPLATLVDHQHK
jgi:hypothetical protein